MNLNYILVAICFIPLVLYLIKLRNFKLTVKKMVVIAMFSGISFILGNITFIQYPQGGGISLLPSLPVLLIGLIYSPVEGMTAGLITGVLSLFGGYIIHPIQLFLDFIIPPMILGLSGMLGADSKKKIFLGCLIVVFLKCWVHVISGVVYFSAYAKGFNMGPWLYSIIYNFSSEGVEGLLSSIVATILPIGKIKKEANKNSQASA